MTDSDPRRRELRIGLMLRGIDEVDGPGVYVRGLCDALVSLESGCRFHAYYMTEDQAGRYTHLPHVEERVVRSPSVFLWDQVLIPLRAASDRLDVLFHHKFTIPLVAPCPTVVEQQGAEYWTHPEWYGTVERWHAKICIPAYCRSAERVLAISRSLAHQLEPYVGIPSSEIEHVYAAAHSRFQRVVDASRLEEVVARYDLPSEPFFLMVAKGYSSATLHGEDFYPRKNAGGGIEAYALACEASGVQDPPPLVVAGPGFDEKTTARYTRGLDPSLRVSFPGFVSYEDMPALYSLATALIFPSYSESFGIPLVEAMACGCPVVASNVTACPEVVSDAGILVDPHSPEEMAEAMRALMEDNDLRRRLAEKSRRRAAEFSWEDSAGKLLSILVDAATTPGAVS